MSTRQLIVKNATFARKSSLTCDHPATQPCLVPIQRYPPTRPRSCNRQNARGSLKNDSENWISVFVFAREFASAVVATGFEAPCVFVAVGEGEAALTVVHVKSVLVTNSLVLWRWMHEMRILFKKFKKK